MKRLQIIVKPNGQTVVETQGFAGPTCQLATRFLETALGQTTQQEVTAEYYQTTITQEQIPQK